MLYIAITPWYVWTAIVMIGWPSLLVFSFVRLRLTNSSMVALLGILLLQCTSAIAAVHLTRVNAIHPYACLLGIYGTMATLILSVIQIVFVLYLFAKWPRDERDNRIGLVPWVSMWLLLYVATFLMHARSAVLCTV